MSTLKIQKMGGSLPAWDVRDLPENQAAFAQNCFLYSGAAQGWRLPKLLRMLSNSAAKFAYRIPTISSAIATAYLIVQSPQAGDSITVGELTYQFTTTPQNPGDVLLGSSTTASANNLFQALNFPAADPVVVGTGTAQNTAISPNNPYAGFPFSNTNVTSTPGANTVFLVPVTPLGTMNLNSLSFVPQQTNAGAKFIGLLYSDFQELNPVTNTLVHSPNLLINKTVQVQGTTAGTTLTAAFADLGLLLQANTTYWIGFMTDSNVAISQASTGTQGAVAAQNYNLGPPNPISGLQVAGPAVTPLPVTLGKPTWQIWGNMVLNAQHGTLVNTSESTIGTANFGAGVVPALTIQAAAIGTAFNTVPVSDNTGHVRLTWLRDLLSVADTTATLVGGANQSEDNTITGVSTWLEFLDPDTNVVRSPIVEDAWSRYYFASPSQEPQYNTLQRIQQGSPAFFLGVPSPTVAPTVVPSGTFTGTEVGRTTSNGQFVGPVLVPASGGSGAIAMRIFVPAACEVTGVGWLPVQTNGSQNGATAPVGCTLFNDNNGSVGTVVASTSGTDNTFSGVAVFASTQTLTANTYYWVAITVGNDVGNHPGQVYLSDSNNYNTYINAASSNPTMTAGAPDVAFWLNLTTSLSLNIAEARSYVYTWVTAYGEEGAPSPPTTQNGPVLDQWNIGLTPPPATMQGTTRNITATNIYRTVPGQQGGTVFFFVAQVDAATASYTDTLTDAAVALNAQLASTTWTPPPADLAGMVSMPNGMLAGFRANEVWFCEPYRPHAWPAKYVVTVEFPIVGIGVAGQALIVATTANPYVVAGQNPSNMASTRVGHSAPCISRGSILSTELRVVYASPLGLIAITPGAIFTNITEAWITKDKWENLTPQKNLRAIRHLSAYFALGTTNGTDTSVAQQGYTVEMSEVVDRDSFTIWPQPGGHRVGFNQMTAPGGVNVDNILLDPWSSVAYAIWGGNIYYWDFTDPLPQMQPYKWRSKVYQGPKKHNFAAFRVWFDVPAATPLPPLQRATPVPSFQPGLTNMVLGPTMYGIVRVLADGAYVCERELRVSEELLRVSSNLKASSWQFEIEARVSVSNIKAASSVKELAKIS